MIAKKKGKEGRSRKEGASVKERRNKDGHTRPTNTQKRKKNENQ